MSRAGGATAAIQATVQTVVNAITQASKPKFFATTKKGEVFELKADLNSGDRFRKKDAVKRVIANMTVGKDVSSLFADVLKCMQTEDLELKKLVYLYLMNYAKTQPELVILAVNTFVKDSEDPNPLIRALAIRTMGCLRVDRILDYIADPIRKGLKDDNPYVRKTATICVAKLYDLSPQMASENGFVEQLQEMLSDSNPMVVANSVAALSEIAESSSAAFVINTSILNKLLAALNECTEWGQTFILDSLAKYTPGDSREAESIAERVLPRLQHVNGSVVLSAVKVLMRYMNLIHNEDFVKQLIKKLSPPLVTLLSSQPEVQYVALRNINLILQKRPDVLSQEMRVFFCKYNDPPYVKLEKLEIMIKLASDKNIDQVLSEFKEYATEVDVDFVRKSVRAIGRCAIKIERATERAINVLLDLIKTKVNYVVQEAIIVIKDIFRRFPNRYEGIIPLLCENLDSLDEPEAKASMVWIIGEYGERIDNAEDLLQTFLETFDDEMVLVQLQLLTATVKLFLKKPDTCQALVQKALQNATSGSDNPDLRDRAYVYWRLLSTDPQVAKAVVLAERPPIRDETSELEPSLLDDLIANISTVASVYHKPESTFLGTGRAGPNYLSIAAEDKDRDGADSPPPEAENEVGVVAGDLLDLDLGAPTLTTGSTPKPSGANDLLDLLGDDSGISAGLASPLAQGLVYPKIVLLPASQGKGLEISGTFARRGPQVAFDLQFTNNSLQPMTDFAIQFNKNFFGLAPAAALKVPSPLMPNQSVQTALILSAGGPVQKMEPPNLLQIAVKNNVEVFYFQTLIPLHVLFNSPNKPIDQGSFSNSWGSSLPGATSTFAGIPYIPLPGAASTVASKLSSNNIIIVAHQAEVQMFTSAVTDSGVEILSEIILNPATGSIQVNAKSAQEEYVAMYLQAIEGILRS